MKKILLPVLALALGLQSCSEDFEVAAPYKPVTIAYGMLNMRDTAHYIRIQKSFLDQNKNAFDMAKVSDSNFYKESDLDVMIKEFSGSALVGSPFTLQRVEMAAEGYPKDPGSFFTGPNYAYKFKKVLDPTHTYRLVINNKANNTMDSAEVEIVDAAKLGLSGGDSVMRPLKFSNPAAGQVFSLFLDPGVVNNAYLVDVAIRFRWESKDKFNGTVTRDSADFPFATIWGDDLKQLKIQTDNSEIYNFLSAEMKSASANEERYMDSCDIFVYGYGKEYYDYVATLQIQASGLTVDQIKPQYTNIVGKDVFGLFSSRTGRVHKRAYIDDATMEALKTNELVADLKIVGRVFP